jgi:hypothetical protein
MGPKCARGVQVRPSVNDDQAVHHKYHYRHDKAAAHGIDLHHNAPAVIELTMVDVARDSSASSGPATDPDPNRPAESSVSGAGNALRLIATIGSPIAIATGLLFYFGWARASVQARQLGYDTAILDWSVQDYILRSILVLFIPLMLLVALMLLLTWLHQRLVLPMADSGRLATWLPRALRGAWLLWVTVAVTLSVLAAPLSGILVATAVTVSLLCSLYADLLERRLTGRTRTSSVAEALVLVLLAFAVFWEAERLANLVGKAYATQITANPRQLLAVTVYSSKSLEIHVQGVAETKLSNPQSAYRYRYDGLRLVQRSGDRYLLMSEHWDARTSRIIVLRETDATRMEFSRDAADK